MNLPLIFPAGAGQCDDCGGTGQAFTNPVIPDTELKQAKIYFDQCSICAGRGWLEKGHTNIRCCANDGCLQTLAPDHIAIYCSNNCALDDF